MALPSDGEADIGLLQLDRLRIAVAGDSRSQPVGNVQQPSIAGLVENRTSCPSVTTRPSCAAAFF
jgi:hypothetical protein